MCGEDLLCLRLVKDGIPISSQIIAGVRYSLASGFETSDCNTEAICRLENYSLIREISAGKEIVRQMEIQLKDVPALGVVVKTFRAPSVLRKLLSFGRASKAQRAFRAAQILCAHGVGTPKPILLAETLSPKGKILESRLVTEFVPELTDFRHEMQRLLAAGDNAESIAMLMQAVADACRRFHDCGIIHHDLGNQNIGLRRNSAGTWEIFFFDLDRVRIFPAGTLSDAQRGRDLARLDLPSELRAFFTCMYSRDHSRVPELNRGLRKGLAAWNFHCKTRIFRHPIQTISRNLAVWRKGAHESPLEGRGLWIWDEKTEQPIVVHNRKHANKFRPFLNILRTVKFILTHGCAVFKCFRTISAQSFSVPVDFSKTIGIAIEADVSTWEMQIRWLAELEAPARAKLPILLRIYHHKGRAHWEFAIEKAQALHARGNAVALALVQDRAAVRVPASWREMVLLVVEKTHNFADFYEIGHATNRGKWGVWDFSDYKKLLVSAIEAKKKFPQIKLTGPACIDFDLHKLPGILSIVPAGTFDALSQHLYVDRRGAPENFQEKFDLVGKCAIYRAIAKKYGFSNEKIIISETNYPLIGVETFSPCAAFYCPNGPLWAPHVSEEDYAKFMTRYLLLAIASGHVSRVYWWRLVHRGFGLVDDTNAQNPRPMPAFFALQNLIATLAGTRFERKLPTPAGTFALEFSRETGTRFVLRWTKDSFPAQEEIAP